MPQYLYQNLETEEVVEIFQKMNDVHQYHGEDGTEEGRWRRIFTVPQMSMATQIDPFSRSQFVRAAEGKNMTIGDEWDKSREMSEKRAALNGGEDPVKRKYFDDYKKDRKGAIHPDDRSKIIEGKGIKIEL